MAGEMTARDEGMGVPADTMGVGAGVSTGVDHAIGLGVGEVVMVGAMTGVAGRGCTRHDSSTLESDRTRMETDNLTSLQSKDLAHC